jgi:WD40 repeat protein
MPRVIVFGTYTHGVCGVDVNSGSEGITLSQRFGYAAHNGIVKSLCANGPMLLSLSTDEHAKLYNLATRSELASAMEQHGGFTCSTIAGVYLVAGNEDGTLSLISTKTMLRTKTLKGHSGPVNGVASHESGKAALSVGRDKRLLLWDLVNGSCALKTDLPVEATKVEWGLNSTVYALAMDKVVQIHNAATGELVAKMTHPTRVHAIVFLEDTLVTGAEDGALRVFDLSAVTLNKEIEKKDRRDKDKDGKGKDKKEKKEPETPEAPLLLEAMAHGKSRIREMVVVDGAVISTSSDGILNIWDIDVASGEAKVLSSIQTGQRITALTATSWDSDSESSGDGEGAEEEAEEAEEEVAAAAVQKPIESGKKKKAKAPQKEAEETKVTTAGKPKAGVKRAAPEQQQQQQQQQRKKK